MQINFYRVRIPFLRPFTTSFGTEEYREALLFRISHEGIDAYSESVTSVIPDYGYEDNTTAMHVIRDLAAKYIADLPDPATFMERVKGIKGHNMAKAALEMLLWDYHSKASNQPLYRYLGKSRGYANVGISIGMAKIEDMEDQIEKALSLGYKRIKVKIARGRENIVKEIRDSFPDIPLSVDANGDYGAADIPRLKDLDRYDLEYIEQPFPGDDLIYHSKLKKEISTPICLDESITSADKALKAFDIGAADVINIKPGRIGGFSESLKVAEIARENGGHVWVGGMLETGIGRAFNIAFASLEMVDYPGDTSPNEKYFGKDIVLNPFKMKNGIIEPYHDAGIGVRIDEGALIRYMVEAGTISV
ncbi:o-succinylbenzoate synthase [Thermoplasma sp.]|uniref:o-succinylbenzoate synthase n=1 Tax=Thermoplasma sp. TaxID=1973142 RepID=UPI0026038E41|nr:o-succinylbenzoate synthase [Thermoplasma sp.]